LTHIIDCVSRFIFVQLKVQENKPAHTLQQSPARPKLERRNLVDQAFAQRRRRRIRTAVVFLILPSASFRRNPEDRCNIDFHQYRVLQSSVYPCLSCDQYSQCTNVSVQKQVALYLSRRLLQTVCQTNVCLLHPACSQT